MNQSLMEITEEDFETIDYINANSHIGIEFMKELGDIDTNFNSDHDFSYHETSVEGLVIGTGYYIDELDGAYLSKVEINGNDLQSDIIGVKNGDVYKDAIKKLEEQGFNIYKEETIGNGLNQVYCNKGRVAIRFYYYTKKNIEKNDCTIDKLTVMLYSDKKTSSDSSRNIMK